MTNAIHADEKQSREGLLLGLDRGRAACPLDCLRKRGSGFYRFRGFSGGGAAHKNIEAPQSMDGAMLESTFQVTSPHLSSMPMKSFYLTGTMLSAIVGEKTGGNAMFGKFQDSLLFVVLAYAIFRIGWGEGFTTMNIFILLGSLVAILSMVLRRSGYLETVEKKKKEAEEKKKNV